MSGKRTELSDLSPDQREVATSFGRGIAVMAGAGSGKTTTLVIKCEELLKRFPEARFAAVSFTEKSASDLRAKLGARLSLDGGGGPGGGHWVMTIHGLCGAIIGEFPREAGFDGEESMLSEQDAAGLWSRALEGLWFEELPEDVEPAIRLLLERESRKDLEALLTRVRELASFGALEFLARAPEGPQGEASRALGAVSRYALERYDRLKRRRGGMDFNDLERGADRALEHAHVREAFHRRFELVLVDEFQDTNPIQSRVITRFCRPDLSNLCVVGDPKQSIYRFRDADVTLFEEFCARLPLSKSLTWNFRSRPGIIDYANSVCARAFDASGMKYEPLEARREPGAFEPVERLDVEAPAELARWIREENARGVPLEDMALLVRRIRGNEHWIKALTAAEIPIAVGSGGLFWEDPRVRELVSLLRWWDNPGNAYSGMVFLRAPWAGIDDRTLDAWSRGDLRAAFLASGHPLALALAPFQGRGVRPGEILMALLVSEAVEAEIGAPCLGLWHRAEELSSRGLDFHAGVQELSRAMEEKSRSRDVPPPRNRGQLSVLTFHSSKGLEFPHVILIDFGKKPRARPAPALFWDRHKGTYLVARDEEGDRDKEAPGYGEWDALEKDKSLAESKRLFYVALTRAKERLLFVCERLDEKDEAKNADRDVVFAEENWRGWIEHAGVEPARVSLAQDSGGSAVVPPPSESAASRLSGSGGAASRLFRPRHSVTEWNLLSRCPRAYEWGYIRPRAAENCAPGSFSPETAPTALALAAPAPAGVAIDPSPGLTQRELGTRVHACLETEDHEGLAALEAEAGSERFRAGPVIEWARRSSQGGGILSGAHWSELAFEVPIGGEVLVGSMDRLQRDHRGGWAVIDFKVTERERSAAALTEAYLTQMALYAEALKRLEPGCGEPRRVIVNLSPEGVNEIELPAGGVDVEALARQAAAIVSGEAGAPRPGKLCAYCDFRSSCPDAES